MTDEELVAALRNLGTATARDAAARAIRAWLEREAAKIRIVPTSRDDVIQRVLITLYEKRDKICTVGRPVPYVERMLENARNDDWRKLRQTASLDPASEAPVAPLPTVDERSLQAVRALFEKMLARAKENRAERYREDLERDARVVLALALGEVKTDDLTAGEQLDGPDARKTIVARLQQRQSRTRRELRVAALELKAAGTIDDDELRVLLRACANRISCQRNPSGTSS